MKASRIRSVEERFWSKVDKNGPMPDQTVPAYQGLGCCWVWTAAKKDGYGIFCPVGSKTVKVHRYHWSLVFGAIRSDQWVQHRCDNPSCLRISHLELGNSKSNTADMWSKGRASPPPVAFGNDNHVHRNPEQVQGENNPAAKISERDVRTIRYMSEFGASNGVIAMSFSLNRSHVSDIINRRVWPKVA